MRIDRLSPKSFANIGQEWDELLQRSGRDSIFLTWEWVHTWWNVFGNDDNKLYVLTAQNTEGQMVGVAPCYATHGKRFKVLPVREVGFLGCGENVSPEYLDFITIPERREEIVRAFFDYFFDNQTDWDVLNLTDLLPDSPVIDYAKELQRKNGFHLIQTESACCPYATLPDNWEAYINSLSKNTRYNIRRKIRKLEREFNVNFYRWSDVNTLERAMQRLAELHTKRWDQQNIPHSFSDDKYNQFHQEVAQRLDKAGLLRLYALEVDGSIIAMLYGFRYGDKLFYYQSGFDPEYSRYSSGTVLFAYVIQAAIAEHIKEFDFLRGFHSYKYDWAHADRNTARLAIGRNNIAAKTYFIGEFGEQRMKNYLRETLPHGVYEFLRFIKNPLAFQDKRIHGKSRAHDDDGTDNL